MVGVLVQVSHRLQCGGIHSCSGHTDPVSLSGGVAVTEKSASSVMEIERRTVHETESGKERLCASLEVAAQWVKGKPAYV